ncbi:MAG TPA: DUF4402 domain-containing protein [Thermoanaerobaculia bacterium]|nr:DUF4402 domain-containing protein [Thermoanaerobaculia bacterium]
MNRRIAFALVVVSLFSVAAFGQASATATANATARVVTPIAIAKLTDLNFGSLIASPAAGTVTIDPAGTRTSGGGVTLLNSPYSAATFNVTGEPLTAYTITLPNAIPIVHTVNNAFTMVVNTFASNPSGTGTLSALGAQQLNVGATLQVAAGQASGLYTGTFDVTVAY